MFSTNVQIVLLVSTRLKVPHHRVERLAARRAFRVEDPCALGAAPTAKARLVYPYQLTRHGRIIRLRSVAANSKRHRNAWMEFAPSGHYRSVFYDGLG